MAADKERDPGASSAEIGKYLDILAKDPNSRVFAPLAEAYRKSGLYDDAVEIALEGLKVHPNYLGGRVALGRAYFEKKQYAEATAEMQKVVKAAPDNIIAHKVLGQIAYSQSDLPAAQKAFKMVLLLDPRDQEAQQFITNLGGDSRPAPQPEPDVPMLTMPAPPPPPPQPLPYQTPSQQTIVAMKPPSVAPPAPLPFDEIQEIEDIDLQADDIFGDFQPDSSPAPAAQSTSPLRQPAAQPSAFPAEFPLEIPSGFPAASPSAPLPEPAAATSFEEFADDAPLDLADPDSWLPERKSPAVSRPAFQQPAPAAATVVSTPVSGTPRPAGIPAPIPVVPKSPGISLPVPDAPKPPVVSSWDSVGSLDPVVAAPPPPVIPKPPVAAPPVPVQAPPAPDGGMELEVFSRDSGGDGQEIAAPSLSTAAAPPGETVGGADSPFEVFGRPKRGGPPQSTKGEQSAFGEIDLESTAYEAVPTEPEPESDSPFEVFTRAPGQSPAPAPVKSERDGRVGPRELDIETTAYNPPDIFPAADGDSSLMSLDDELPRIDLAQEMEFGLMVDSPESPTPPATAVAEPLPDYDPEPGGGIELDLDQGLDVGVGPAPAPVVDAPFEARPPAAGFSPEPPPLDPGGDAAQLRDEPFETRFEETPRWDEPDRTVSFDEGLPSIDPGQDEPLDLFGEGDEDVAAPEESPDAAAGRGVFDTETLAAIYVKQGFFGRAAEIYRKLISQRPDDRSLRGKLEDVLVLARGAEGEGGSFAPVSEPPGGYQPQGFLPGAAIDPAAAMRTGPELLVGRLEALLETFKGGRPR